jgi:hypothetical protein
MAYFSTGSGRIELQIELDHANAGHHQGQCDADIERLLTVDYIKAQLDAIPPALLADELREYGAWDQDELADHEQNKARILWLACGDITDQQFEDN